jgi:hypothetical protein
MGGRDTGHATITHNHSWLSLIRVAGLWLAAILAGLAFGIYILVRYVERQILTTDNYVTMVSTLPKDTRVSTALGNYIGNAVFDSQSVETKITQALPPRADFLAAPLTSQLQSLTNKTAQKIVASDAFLTVWTGANRAAMNRLVATSRGQPTPLQQRINQRFNLNLGDSRGRLSAALGSAAGAIPALQPTSQKVLALSTDLKTRPRRLQQVVKTTDSLSAILPFVIIGSLLAAIALSYRRRLTLLYTSIGVIVLALIELIAIRWLRGYTLDQIKNPANTSAVSYIYDTVMHSLRYSLGLTLFIMIVAIIVLLLAGPARVAEKVRGWLYIDRLRRSQVGELWQSARQWMMRWKYYFWLGSGIVVLGFVAVADAVNGRLIIQAIFLILSLWSLIYIFATPRNLAI